MLHLWIACSCSKPARGTQNVQFLQGKSSRFHDPRETLVIICPTGIHCSISRSIVHCGIAGADLFRAEWLTKLNLTDHRRMIVRRLNGCRQQLAQFLFRGFRCEHADLPVLRPTGSRPAIFFCEPRLIWRGMTEVGSICHYQMDQLIPAHPKTYNRHRLPTGRDRLTAEGGESLQPDRHRFRCRRVSRLKPMPQCPAVGCDMIELGLAGC